MTRQIESAVQDRTVADYRNAWGYPLGINQRDAGSAFVVVLCGLGIASCLALGWLL